MDMSRGHHQRILAGSLFTELHLSRKTGCQLEHGFERGLGGSWETMRGLSRVIAVRIDRYKWDESFSW